MSTRTSAALVEITDGRRLYLECAGSGFPTVILESGYSHSARVWTTDVVSQGWQPPAAPRTTVFDGVRALTRVCAYDRPGTIFPVPPSFERSHSDAAPMPRSAGALVADLHTALEAAGIGGPYVFVGHSLGGSLARIFAARYPGEVAGMVLVDAFSGALWSGFARELTARDWEALQALEEGPKAELRTAYPDAETVDLDDVIAAEAASSVPPMPLAVLTRGRPLSDAVPPEIVPEGFDWETAERVASNAQEALATLVPGARHEIAKESGHLIQLDQPDLVIAAIRDVVEAVRAQRATLDR